MMDWMANLKQKTVRLDSCKRENIELDAIKIEAGALSAATPYVRQKGCRTVVVAADKTTYQAAGERLSRDLSKEGVDVVV